MRLFGFNWVTAGRKRVSSKGYYESRLSRCNDDLKVLKVFCGGVPSKRDTELFNEYRYLTANVKWYRKRLKSK